MANKNSGLTAGSYVQPEVRHSGHLRECLRVAVVIPDAATASRDYVRQARSVFRVSDKFSRSLVASGPRFTASRVALSRAYKSGTSE